MKDYGKMKNMLLWATLVGFMASCSTTSNNNFARTKHRQNHKMVRIDNGRQQQDLTSLNIPEPEIHANASLETPGVVSIADRPEPASEIKTGTQAVSAVKQARQKIRMAKKSVLEEGGFPVVDKTKSNQLHATPASVTHVQDSQSSNNNTLLIILLILLLVILLSGFGGWLAWEILYILLVVVLVFLFLRLLGII